MVHLRWFSSAVFARFCKKRFHIERVTQANACATRSQPHKPASLRDAGFAAPYGGAGMWLLSFARVWLCDMID